jgi:CubicO group peptidase (beta-lactamase class C family)
VQRVLNRRSTRAAVIPSAGISTTARDLATFYDMLVHDGRAGDSSILRPETVTLAGIPSSEGEVDRYARFEMRWAQGFQLGGGGASADARGSIGRLANPRTFGQNGSSCCIGWADPDQRLVLTYLTDRFVGRRAGSDHQVAVADAVINACGPLPPAAA